MASTVLLMVVVAGGCGGDPEPNSPGVDAGWTSFRVTGDEVEGFASLAEMARSADLVVRGRFVRQVDGREIRGDGSDDPVVYATGIFEIDEVLRGDQAKQLSVEFLAAPSFKVPLGDDIVIFARAKRGEQEEGLFRPVNSLGLWAEVDGSVVTPIAERSSDGPVLYEAEIANAQKMDEFVARVRDVASG